MKKLTFTSVFKYLAILLVACNIPLIKFSDLSWHANTPVYIGLMAAVMLFISMFLADKEGKKEKRP